MFRAKIRKNYQIFSDEFAEKKTSMLHGHFLTFSKFYRRHYELISKFNVRLNVKVDNDQEMVQ